MKFIKLRFSFTIIFAMLVVTLVTFVVSYKTGNTSMIPFPIIRVFDFIWD